MNRHFHPEPRAPLIGIERSFGRTVGLEGIQHDLDAGGVSLRKIQFLEEIPQSAVTVTPREDVACIKSSIRMERSGAADIVDVQCVWLGPNPYRFRFLMVTVIVTVGQKFLQRAAGIVRNRQTDGRCPGCGSGCRPRRPNPHCSATHSSRVDLPEPFSPTKNVTSPRIPIRQPMPDTRQETASAQRRDGYA